MREATAWNFAAKGLVKCTKADSKTIARLTKAGVEIEDAPEPKKKAAASAT